MRLIIVTGLSGSGKSVAIRQLEDIGYYCIDNLPLSFIIPVAKNSRLCCFRSGCSQQLFRH